MVKTLDKELKRGTLEMVLLKLLTGRAMYGYEIVAALEKLAEQQFQLKEGTLYPVLYRLENDGFVEARWETQERGVPRKYYHITALGKTELERLLAEWRAFSQTLNRILDAEFE